MTLALSERTRRLLRWAGYPLFALFVFFCFLYLTFPWEKLKYRVEGYLASSGEMEVSIGSLGPAPLLGVSAEQVALTLKPKPGEMPPPEPTEAGVAPAKPRATRILLDQVTVRFGLFAILGGGVDVSFAISGFGGELDGRYRSDKKKTWSARFEASKLELGRLPMVQSAVGLPVAGTFSAKADIEVPEDRWSDASGLVEIECESCSVGDGKAKLKVPGNPLLAMGVTLPQLRLGRFGGKIKIEKGVATLENVSAQSPDIEVALEGQLLLRSPFPYSNAQAYLRFKISPELKKRDAKFELLENGMTNAKRADGFFGLRVDGPLRALRFLPSSLGPGGGGAPLRLGPGGAPRPGYRRMPVPGGPPG